MHPALMRESLAETNVSAGSNGVVGAVDMRVAGAVGGTLGGLLGLPRVLPRLALAQLFRDRRGNAVDKHEGESAVEAPVHR